MGEGATNRMPELGKDRFYRAWASGKGLCAFEAAVGETDLQIFADFPLPAEADAAIRRARRDIELYAVGHDGFIGSLEPLEVLPGAPDIVRKMCEAGWLYGVGPMAAVAGVVAEYVGRDLLGRSSQIIVENGGDVFFTMSEPPTFGLYAGKHSPFTGKVRFAPSEMTEGGVCTSSGTVGHSISFGHADAVVALANNTALADAAATAIANSIRSAEDVQPAIDAEKERGILEGGLIAIGDALGAWGSITILEGA